MEGVPPCGVRPSLLERFFAKYEFTCQYQLSCSDCQAWSTQEVLAQASDEERTLWDEATLGYTETLGHPLLLQAIWQRYRSKVEEHQPTGGELPLDVKEQTAVSITACVPVEGIYIAMTQLLEPGDVVIAMDPAYQALTEIARSRGCEIVSWKPHLVGQYDADNFWDFRLEDLKFLLQQCLQDRKRLKKLGLEEQQRKHFEKIVALRDYTTLCLPVHSEILAIIALHGAEAFLKRNRQICNENYQILKAWG
eukprot:Skav227497  [mRNA]  locus=scaffold282:161782:166799:+ [translate_table: standard]